jgi:hypothetical protein
MLFVARFRSTLATSSKADRRVPCCLRGVELAPSIGPDVTTSVKHPWNTVSDIE